MEHLQASYYWFMEAEIWLLEAQQALRAIEPNQDHRATIPPHGCGLDMRIACRRLLLRRSHRACAATESNSRQLFRRHWH